MVGQLFNGLSEVHAAGKALLDVKPDNIMLQLPGGIRAASSSPLDSSSLRQQLLFNSAGSIRDATLRLVDMGLVREVPDWTLCAHDPDTFTSGW